VNNVLGKGSGSVAMLLGLVITIAVQSSSITTSILIPLAAAGVLSLRNAYPVTLGANVGTTITALLAALAASVPEALTVGLAHTTFNVLGIALLYVPRFIRYVPVLLAEGLATVAVKSPVWAVVYVMTAFIVLPLVGLLLLQ
jgi:sodium-dependent phosphate cotransporter